MSEKDHPAYFYSVIKRQFKPLPMFRRPAVVMPSADKLCMQGGYCGRGTNNRSQGIITKRDPY